MSEPMLIAVFAVAYVLGWFLARWVFDGPEVHGEGPESSPVMLATFWPLFAALALGLSPVLLFFGLEWLYKRLFVVEDADDA